MKCSKSVLPTVTIALGLWAMANWSASAGTIFSDNFATDSSLAQPPWYNISSSSTATYALNPTAGQGLALTVSSGTGRDQEMFAQFASSPVTLANAGDYITLTVNFNGSGMAVDTGALLVGLYNTEGTPGNGDEVNTDTGGATADDKGYFGDMGYNTSAGLSTKFDTRTGSATDANELGYYSKMTSGSYNQLSSFSASGNADLADNTAYTLTYTIMNNGSSGNIMTAQIINGVSTLDNWVTTDTTGTGGAGLYNSFDELVFGNYGKAGPVGINITSVSVDYVQAVPEPSVFALAGLGLFGLVLRFRRR